MEAEGQLHLLGCRVRLQGTDDLRRDESCQGTSGGRAALSPNPRAGYRVATTYLVIVLLCVLVELVQSYEGVQGVSVGLGKGGGRVSYRQERRGGGGKHRGTEVTPEFQHILDSPLAHPAGLSLLNLRQGQRPRTPRPLTREISAKCVFMSWSLTCTICRTPL